MNKAFYFKLALNNIKRNARMYTPYLLVGSFIVALFYMLNALSRNEDIGHDTLLDILSFGRYIIGIFSVIILLYTNIFLMRRRQKELGLYSILGMDSSNIAQMLFWETVIVAVATLLSGLSVGILLNKLMHLVLISMTGFNLSFGMPISGVALVATILLFLISYYIIFICNMARVRFTKPIDLLSGGQKGEREPESKWLIMLVGLAMLGGGYYISLTNQNPHRSLELFFIAVLMVMIGTYCLFAAGITIILKALRKNKRVYYNSHYFIVISGLLYRVKQNAIGLATICILCTMVLTTLSITASLFFGNEEINQNQLDYEFQINIHNPTHDQTKDIHELINQLLEPYEVQLDDVKEVKSLWIMTLKIDENFYFDSGLEWDEELELVESGGAQWYRFFVIDENSYNTLTGSNYSLAEHEVLVFGLDDRASQIVIQDQELTVLRVLKEFPEDIDFGLVVKDMDVAVNLTQGEFTQRIWFDTGLSHEEALEFSLQLGENLGQIEDMLVWYHSRPEAGQRAASSSGGLLFVGIFVGILFLMTTGLILYYKQISEGFEDRERFKMMQKVGMSKVEVKKTIRTQARFVFFLPLIIAIIHVSFAFNIITNLLAMFDLTNVRLFAICTAVIIGIFTIVYGSLYHMTAQVYYKIVSSFN